MERTDPYHGLQWETMESWQVESFFIYYYYVLHIQVESWEGSLDPEGRLPLLLFPAFLDVESRWHGKGLLRLAEGGEVAAVWKNGKREGKATITSPANGIVSLVGEYRCTQDEHHHHNLLD